MIMFQCVHRKFIAFYGLGRKTNSKRYQRMTKRNLQVVKERFVISVAHLLNGQVCNRDDDPHICLCDF